MRNEHSHNTHCSNTNIPPLLPPYPPSAYEPLRKLPILSPE